MPKQERFTLSLSLDQMKFIVDATGSATGCMDPDDEYTDWCEDQAVRFRCLLQKWKGRDE